LRPWLKSFAAPRLNKDADIAAAFFITSVYANTQLGQFCSVTARISLIPVKARGLSLRLRVVALADRDSRDYADRL
jgi:hypothetical protein